MANRHDVSVVSTSVQTATSLVILWWFAEMSKTVDKPDPLNHPARFAKRVELVQVGL